jgi:hypothetical protein
MQISPPVNAHSRSMCSLFDYIANRLSKDKNEAVNSKIFDNKNNKNALAIDT